MTGEEAQASQALQGFSKGDLQLESICTDDQERQLQRFYLCKSLRIAGLQVPICNIVLFETELRKRLSGGTEGEGEGKADHGEID
jgi:hypothetical protein